MIPTDPPYQANYTCNCCLSAYEGRALEVVINYDGVPAPTYLVLEDDTVVITTTTFNPITKELDATVAGVTVGECIDISLCCVPSDYIWSKELTPTGKYVDCL